MTKCKRFLINDPETNKNYFLIGILTLESGNFWHIRTRMKKYCINQSLILKVEETEQEFEYLK